MTTDEVRQRLVDFFRWRPRDVMKLNQYEIAAWEKHLIALIEIEERYRNASVAAK